MECQQRVTSSLCVFKHKHTDLMFWVSLRIKCSQKKNTTSNEHNIPMAKHGGWWQHHALRGLRRGCESATFSVQRAAAAPVATK